MNCFYSISECFFFYLINFYISVKFHISHLYEVQNNYKKAKEGYELLLGDKQLTLQLKADVCRQLGKMKFYYAINSE